MSICFTLTLDNDRRGREAAHLVRRCRILGQLKLYTIQMLNRKVGENKNYEILLFIQPAGLLLNNHAFHSLGRLVLFLIFQFQLNVICRSFNR